MFTRVFGALYLHHDLIFYRDTMDINELDTHLNNRFLPNCESKRSKHVAAMRKTKHPYLLARRYRSSSVYILHSFRGFSTSFRLHEYRIILHHESDVGTL